MFQLQCVPLVLFPQQRQDTEQLNLQPWSRDTMVVKVQWQLPSNHLPHDGHKTARQLLVIVRVLLRTKQTSHVTPTAANSEAGANT